MNTKKKCFLLHFLALLFVISGTAFNVSAQDDSEGSIIKLEDITVTARKIEENLQDTPIAVTVMTGEVAVLDAVQDGDDAQFQLAAAQGLHTEVGTDGEQENPKRAGHPCQGKPAIVFE